MKKKYFFTISIIILGILTLLKINVKHNNTLAVYIDNELKNNIPSKTDNLYINKIDCDNDTTATWDNDNWGLFISNLSKKAKCNLYFIHDNEKPYWQIESVEKVNVLSTDILEFKISGNDSLGSVSPTLDVSNLSFYVNDELESPIKVELAKQEELNKKITYSIKVHMVGGEGILKLKINSNTLTDTSGNQNDEAILDTGITISKNPAKILYYYNSSTETWTFDNRTSLIKNYYNNITFTSNYTIDKILEDKYDLVICDDYVWGVNNITNKIFENNINIFSMGNDSDHGLKIIDNSSWNTGNEQTEKINNDILSDYLPKNLPKDNDSQRLIKFSSNVTVIYTNYTNNETYDTVGFLKENNKIWFHSQNPDIYIYSIPIIEFTLGELK